MADGVTPAGYYYAANNFFTSELGGTHIDARSISRRAINRRRNPAQRLAGDAVVVDVTRASEQQRDYQITAADVAAWEHDNGAISSNCIVLFRTDFSRRWPDAAAYLGTAERGADAAARLHFPGLHPDAARWLIANRSPKAVGIDTASIDYRTIVSLRNAPRAVRTRHPRVQEPGRSSIACRDRGAVVVALPMKIKGGSGAPLRAVAMLPVKPTECRPRRLRKYYAADTPYELPCDLLMHQI